jgi:hypothetical protein
MTNDDAGLVAAQDQAIAEALDSMRATVLIWNDHMNKCNHTEAEMWSTALTDMHEVSESSLGLMATAGLSVLARLVRQGVLGPDLESANVDPLAVRELTPRDIEIGEACLTAVANTIRTAMADPDITPDDITDLVMCSAKSANETWSRHGLSAGIAAAVYRLALGKGFNA